MDYRFNYSDPLYDPDSSLSRLDLGPCYNASKGVGGAPGALQACALAVTATGRRR